MLSLMLDEVARDAMAERARQARHASLVREAQRTVSRSAQPVRAVQFARAWGVAAADALRALAARLDPHPAAVGIVTSTGTDCVPFQPYARR